MPTTTYKRDFLGRSLVNATPGTSQATDSTGRAVQAGNLDYSGRSLTVPPWSATTAYAVGARAYVPSGAEMEVTVAGTSAAAAPTAPAVGATVTDASVTWRRFA